MTESTTMDCNDDPVVQEIPVYLSKVLADKLFIFQYPLKSNADCFHNNTFRNVLIKPKNQQVRLEVEIDHSKGSANYDHQRGERFASYIDGVSDKFESKEDDSYFSSHTMDKIVLQSSKSVVSSPNYSVGVLKNNAIHITPLNSILPMHTEFNYLDITDKKAKEDAKKLAQDKGQGEIQQISVKFARQATDFAKKMQEKSFMQQSKKSSAEQWIKTGFKQASSHEADMTRLDMLCPSIESSCNNLKLSSGEFLQVLVPTSTDEEHSRLNNSTHGTPRSYVRTLPLLDQIKLLMKEAKVMSFTQLRSLISSEHDTTSLLKYLQQVAVLVQGNWVVNSDLLYPKEYLSPHNGVSSELMCHARDYVLLKFTETGCIDREAISSVIHLQAEDISEIITNLAVRQLKQGWRLLLPADTEFVKKYPDIAHRQELFWDTKRQYLKSIYEAQNSPPKRQRQRSRESISLENEEKNSAKGKRILKDSSTSDNDTADIVKNKKGNRSRKTTGTTGQK